jgi:hypothetical protein
VQQLEGAGDVALVEAEAKIEVLQGENPSA